MRNFLIAVSAVCLILAAPDEAAALLDILGYDGGSVGVGQDFRDENESQWRWADGLVGDSGTDGDIYADGVGHPGWVCAVCRDPEMHTIDYAAVAYNAYFGEDPWAIDSILGVPFRVYNLQLDWVVIWFEDIVLNMPSTHPDTMEVAIRLRTGQIKRIELLQGGPDLPIGDPEPKSNAGDGGGSDGADDDDYDYGDDEEYEEPEIDDPTGVVEIEDPDEDGEFLDWEEEL